MRLSQKDKELIKSFKVKKCPECLKYMPVKSEECTECKTKVGPVNKLGFAERPVAYGRYLGAVFGVAVFIGYIYFAFLMD